MNRIYRLIWNTTLACWVVASEHTRSRGKATRAGRAALAAAALAMAAPVLADDDVFTDQDQEALSSAVEALHLRLYNEALLRGAATDSAPLAANRGMNATVNDTYFANPTLNGENSLALGSRAHVAGSRSTGVGNEVVINGGGHTAVGSKATATGGIDGVAMGINALADGTGNVAIGEAARADTVEGTLAGIHAVAIGARAVAGSPGWTGAVALGGESTARNDGVALGYSASALNIGAVAVGRNASGTGTGAVAVGRYTNAKAEGTIAIGEGAQATYANAIAVGRQARAVGTAGIALGNEARAMGYGNAIGHQADANNSWANAIGFEAKANGAGSSSIGYKATAGSIATVAIGWEAKANAAYSIAQGYMADVNGTAADGIALGRESRVGANARQALAVGMAAQATGASSVALGHLAKAADASAIAVGTEASASGNQSLAVGLRSKANGQTAMVLGMDAQALGNYTTALGHEAKATSAWANAIGYQAQATGSSSVALGSMAAAAGTASVALGDRSQVDATAASSVALGHSAAVLADASNAVALGSGSVASEANSVSVGSAGLKRKIVNVADGEISASSTDAVSGKQLHAIDSRFNGQSIALGENARPEGGRAIAIGYNALVPTNGGVDGIAIGANARGGSSGWTGGVAIGGAATADYDGLALGYDAHVTANSAVALGRGSTANVANTVSVGSDTLKRKIVNVADGALAAASTEAVTGRQLFTTNQNVTTAMNTADTAKVTADAAKLDAVEALGKANHLGGLIGETAPDGSVRLGGENAGVAMDIRNRSGGSRTLSGVAAGALHAGSNEAVNGAQLNAVHERVELHSVAIGVNRLEIGMNRDDLAELREAFDNFEPDLTGVVRYNADRTLVDLDGAGVTGLAAGELSATSRDAVNGTQLFGTNERVEYLELQQRYMMVATDDLSGPAQVDSFGVAIGGDARALAEGATAVGSFAGALGRNSVALGRGSYVGPDATNGFALGTRTNVESVAGMAIGSDSDVMLGADRSVALGSASVATEANTVSLGNDGLKRRVVNIDRGTKDDNATSLIQLREAVTALGGGAAIDAAGDVIAPKYTLSGGSFNNVGDALTSIDTKLVGHQDELDTLDTRYKALLQNDRLIRYNDDRSVVDFGGARVTGVAAGSIKADSGDAVNGAQLFATNERVGGLENRQRFVMIGANELGLPAQAAELGVAIGGDADAREVGATAVGSFATAKGRNSVALGRAAYVAPEGRDGFALGTRTRVQAAGGMAIGADSDVIAGADRSVALGNASVATEANTVAVGNDGLKRRIVHVAQGINSDDATTVSQLRGALTALGGGADLDANGKVIGPRYAVQGSEYGSFGDAITALDGGVGDNKRNLESLDSRFQRLFQESPSANADGAGRLSFGGAQGMVLGNVANGLIGQGSRDAVNGGQLWAVKQDLQGQIDALDPGKGEGSGSSLAMNGRSGSITPSADGGSTLASPEATPPAADPGNVAAQDQLVKAEGDNAVAVGSEGKERQVKHVAEGRADTDAANVRQVNDALERANAYTDSAVASVNQRLDQVDKRINRMAAISSAQSAMAMNTAGLATANRLGAGVGYSEGESAMAVGYQRVLTERGSATFSLNGAFTNSGEKSVGVGVGIGW
ncbi:ESPR-type extended signal peptide-containing protein [Stenotrophomonas sp.]|uniref:ESPR-type extended signal peptide-containing protein n=1 Tax=Stenotrophomonas sp. TaxID=69392 RepID=UPI0029A9F3FD|nr:ESPR-type extended signal peptide-containing protein [Stenotrophomonas sp.]MDX3934009.1 ESPR-type extended signal peptide-containing protein [Stenotrophomonas sp.]